MDDLARNLATNLRRAREARGWTQSRLGKVSGVPRSTLANLETGSGNPTLSVLAALAGALQVSLEELLAAPAGLGRHVPADTLASRTRTGMRITDLLPHPFPRLEVSRYDLPVGVAARGVPHQSGTREVLHAVSGSMAVEVEGTRFELQAGDVVVFQGDRRHRYINTGEVTAVGIGVVALAPVGA